MGRQQGSEAVPQAVSMAGGPRAPGLQPPHQAALFPPLAHLLEGMMPVQNGQHQGCDPTPPRAPRGRRGRDEAIAQRGAFQASSDTKHQRHMCHRMHRLDGHGPDAPPVGTLTRPPPRPQQSHGRAGGAFRTKKRVVQPNPLNLRAKVHGRKTLPVLVLATLRYYKKNGKVIDETHVFSLVEDLANNSWLIEEQTRGTRGQNVR